jgi:hypothetical protein
LSIRVVENSTGGHGSRFLGNRIDKGVIDVLNLALPPGVPLQPVLDAVLPARLEALDRRLSGAGRYLGRGRLTPA